MISERLLTIIQKSFNAGSKIWLLGCAAIYSISAVKAVAIVDANLSFPVLNYSII